MVAPLREQYSRIAIPAALQQRYGLELIIGEC
jgi:hypothetical protein